MKKGLKLWHPIAGIAIVRLLEILNNNLHNSNTWFLFDEIIGQLNSFFAIIFLYVFIRDIYRLIKNIYQSVRCYFKQDKSNPRKSQTMKEIEREMDEIEETLDVVTKATRENGKIVPIWKIDCKEP